MRHIGACVLAGLLAWPCLASAQAQAQDPDRFGYCQVMKIWSDDAKDLAQDMWVSPVFERPVPMGRSYERLTQDQAGFLQATQAQAAVPEGATSSCIYMASREALEKMQHQLKVSSVLGAGSGRLRTIAWSPSPLPEKAPDQDPLVAEQVPAALVATLKADPFFTIPAGKGQVIVRDGKRRSDPGPNGIPVSQQVRAQRQGDFCDVGIHTVAGEGNDAFTSDLQGLSWAGLVPLTGTSRISSRFASGTARQQTRTITHEGDALFPLRQGARSTLVAQFQSRDDAGNTALNSVHWECEVGATASAASLVATATGETTELRCETSFPEVPEAPKQSVRYHWFSDAGCFVHDPGQL